MRILSTLALTGILSILFARSNHGNVGSEAAAMGGTSTTSHNSFSLQNNVAATAFLDQSTIGISVDNRFLFAKLHLLHTAFNYKTEKLGSFSIGNSYSGYSAYYHHITRLAYARKFGKNLSIGLGINHHFLKIEENGSKHLVSIQLASLYSPTEKIRIAIVIVNPIKQKLEKLYKESLESYIKLGLSYHPTTQLTLAIEAMKDLKHPLQLRAGAAYQIHELIYVRIGAALNPTLLSSGIGIQAKKLQIDLAASWYAKLGFAPQLSLQYKFLKDGK